MFNIRTHNEKIMHSNYGKHILFDLVTKDYAVTDSSECKKLIEEYRNFKIESEENPENFSDVKENDNEITSVFPVFITSFDCNYRCTYCCQNEYDKNVATMSPEDIPKILAFYREFDKIYGTKSRVDEIGIMGGEPFLDKNYLFIESVFDSFTDSKISFISNGANLIPYHSLLKNKRKQVKHIVLSVDGDKELHLKYRKAPTEEYYYNIWESIDFLRENDIVVQLKGLYHENEIEHYKKFLDLLSKHAKRPNDYLATLSLDINKIYSDTQYIADAKKSFLELLENDNRASLFWQDILNYSGSSIVRQIYMKEEYRPYKTCGITHSPSYTFLPTGEVYPCSLGIDFGIQIGTFKPEITINTQVVDRIMNRDVRNLKKCQPCEQKHFCKGGCIVRAMANDEEEDTFCGRWKEDDYQESLESVLNQLILDEIYREQKNRIGESY